jgi:acyl carrier protein phosphodiesterase
MNFLAHLYLSGHHEKILIGNFIGDFVKGKQMESFEPQIRWGIELHRKIDEFTDSHPVVSESKGLLQEKYRHYSPVIVDIFYDHFLAKNWQEFHFTTLPFFAERCYQLILQYQTILPEKASFMMPYMIKNNWLVNYAMQEGIQRAMEGMARRTTFHSKMEEAVGDLGAHYGTFEAHFRKFFPDVKAMCERFINEKAPDENPRLFKSLQG